MRLNNVPATGVPVARTQEKAGCRMNERLGRHRLRRGVLQLLHGRATSDGDGPAVGGVHQQDRDPAVVVQDPHAGPAGVHVQVPAPGEEHVRQHGLALLVGRAICRRVEPRAVIVAVGLELRVVHLEDTHQHQGVLDVGRPHRQPDGVHLDGHRVAADHSGDRGAGREALHRDDRLPVPAVVELGQGGLQLRRLVAGDIRGRGRRHRGRCCLGRGRNEWRAVALARVERA